MNIVLGGTSGLGAEIVNGLQERGEDTFVVGRSYDQAKHGAGMAVDLADYESVQELNKYIHDLGKGAVEGFYWTSGSGYNGDFAAQEDAHEMAIVNFANPLSVAQEAWRHILASRAPANFVVISSTTGTRARADEAVYAATKHAQVGFARSLGLEGERLGIEAKVALFMPGGMQTPFWDEARPGSYDQFLDPAKVAGFILDTVWSQQEPYVEETIERGSL